jgi:hypothetical protein
MKSLLLIACLFLSLGIKAQSNVYKPFPLVDGATWKVNWYDLNCLIGNPPMIQGDPDYQYVVQGDTTIQNQNYKLVQRGPFVPANHLCSPNIPYVDTYPHTTGLYIFGGLRQDTLAKKIYFYSFKVNAEYLLYDFAMQIGDTVKGFFAMDTLLDGMGISTTYWCGNCRITSIDSVNLNGEYHKRLWVNLYHTAIIEGIGTDKGLFEPLFAFEADGRLLCTSIGNQTLYGDSLCYQMDLSPVNENTANLGVSIFPNPASEEFTVKVDNPTAKLHIALYNLTGQQVGSYSSGGNQLTIPRNNLPNGVYVAQIEVGSSVVRRKILLVD